MKRVSHPFFMFGKAAYYIGLLLLFNFFFGLIFLRFFVWLIVGGILLGLLWTIAVKTKNMFFSSAQSQDSGQPGGTNYRKAKGGYSDAIDVEAEVFDDK